MARPRKASGEESLRHRLEEALVELVQEKPLERISVGELAARSQCSRSAFYYHCEDLYDLFDGMLARHAPVDWVSAVVGTMFSAHPDGPPDYEKLAGEALAAHERDIERMCLLLGSKAGDRVRDALRESAARAWSQSLGTPVLEGDARLLFEFAFNGILGVLAYCSQRDGGLDYARALSLVTPELPEAFAACLEKSERGARCSSTRRIGPKSPSENKNAARSPLPRC